MGRSIILFLVILAGCALAFPWLRRVGLGRLPGDLVFERGRWRLAVPLASAVLVTFLLSLIIGLAHR